MSEQPLLSIAEAAARLGWSTSKVYRLVRGGHIPAKHVAGKWYLVNLDEWLRQADNPTTSTTAAPRPPAPEPIEELMPSKRRFGTPACAEKST